MLKKLHKFACVSIARIAPSNEFDVDGFNLSVSQIDRSIDFHWGRVSARCKRAISSPERFSSGKHSGRAARVFGRSRLRTFLH